MLLVLKMDSSAGRCEIVEERDDIYSNNLSGRTLPPKPGLAAAERNFDRSVLKVGYKMTIEDDIDKLFQSISVRTSPKEMRASYPTVTSTSTSARTSMSTSPSKKNPLKKPITACMPRSPRIGPSDQVSIKQALRDLCLSKASEMAATKRLPKHTASPRISEAERIKSLYDTVLAESSSRSGVHRDEAKELIRMPTALEESKPSSSHCAIQPIQATAVKSQRESAGTAPLYAVPLDQVKIVATCIQKNDSEFNKTDDMKTHGEIPPKSASTLSITSANNGDETEKNPSASSSMKPPMEQARPMRGERQEKLIRAPSSIPVRGKRLEKTSRNVTRFSRPVVRRRVLLKKKIKPITVPIKAAADSFTWHEGNQLFCQKCRCALANTSIGADPNSFVTADANDAETGSDDLGYDSDKTCNKVNKESIESFEDGVCAEAGLGFDTPSDKQDRSTNNCGGNSLAVGKEKENPTSSEKVEFSLSSKDSIGDYSSTTSLSEESNLSRSSFCYKPHMSKDVRWEAIHHVRMQQGVIGLRHFNLLKKLGCGDIGTVYLAELIGTNCCFAIKVMDNEFLARRKKMPRAQTEKDILRVLDHPFLPTLYSQFTSDNLSCLVMEYCPGGDLHVLRQRQACRCFAEPAARFYVAEVLLALEYLHMLGVIYRDLKPENILVREDGHIMLTDFDLSLRCSVNPTLLRSSSPQIDPARSSGPQTASSCIDPLCIEPSCHVPCFSPKLFPKTSKSRSRKVKKAELIVQLRSLPQLIAEPTSARSNSFVGTHEYLAPEIIKGEGHGAAVDWWTFGVLLYELIYGKTPFKGFNNEETLANVVLQSLKFPDSPLVSFQARDLIRKLLAKEPENRLGTERGAAEIKQHPFFEGLNWALIRCAIPPEMPEPSELGMSSVASPDDSSKYLECKAMGDQLEFELF